MMKAQHVAVYGISSKKQIVYVISYSNSICTLKLQHMILHDDY